MPLYSIPNHEGEMMAYAGRMNPAAERITHYPSNSQTTVRFNHATIAS